MYSVNLLDSTILDARDHENDPQTYTPTKEALLFQSYKNKIKRIKLDRLKVLKEITKKDKIEKSLREGFQGVVTSNIEYSSNDQNMVGVEKP